MKAEWIYKILVNDFDIPTIIQEVDLENLDLVRIRENEYHLLNDRQSYHIRIIAVDLDAKMVSLEVDGHLYEMDVIDPLDELIDSMGLNKSGSHHLEDITAPMPGLVLNVAVENGQQVDRGEPLIILEAMKMENAIKAPADGIIQKVHVQKGDAVDKGTLLISFE